MTQDDALLEPLEGYNKLYKDLHRRYTEEAFDSLVKEGRVDIAANRTTVAQHKHKLEEIEKVKSAISKSRALRIFLIVLSVLLALAGVIALVVSIGGGIPLWAGIISAAAGVVLAVTFTVLIIKKINPKIQIMYFMADSKYIKIRNSK